MSPQFIAGPCVSLWEFGNLLKGTSAVLRCSGSFLYYQNTCNVLATLELELQPLCFSAQPTG